MYISGKSPTGESHRLVLGELDCWPMRFGSLPFCRDGFNLSQATSLTGSTRKKREANVTAEWAGDRSVIRSRDVGLERETGHQCFPLDELKHDQHEFGSWFGVGKLQLAIPTRGC